MDITPAKVREPSLLCASVRERERENGSPDGGATPISRKNETVGVAVNVIVTT